MRILMLSDLETLGGAAVSASRLAEPLAEEHDVLRVVLHADGQRHPWRTHALGAGNRVAGYAFRAARRLLPADLYRPWLGRLALRRLGDVIRAFRPDVINVHNIHGGSDRGWGPELVDLCADHAPTVWTLHDQWSFTGRCAYAYDCRAFEVGCSHACPTPHEYPALRPERIADAWQARRDMLRRRASLSAVAPSRWLAAEARRGLWRWRRVETIPYGLPLETFRPIERREARRRLGMPAAGPIVLIAAQSLTERRKGGEVLSQVWPHLRTRPVTLAAMGHGHIASPDQGIGVCLLGWIGEPEQQTLVYSAADLLLHPAPVDNLPNVVMEAIACGTPVVGLPIGGVPDMVRPNVSGWLADDTSPAALAAALDQALTEIGQGRTLRATCRDLAQSEYALSLQARRYETLFMQMLGQDRAAA